MHCIALVGTQRRYLHWIVRSSADDWVALRSFAGCNVVAYILALDML